MRATLTRTRRKPRRRHVLGLLGLAVKASGERQFEIASQIPVDDSEHGPGLSFDIVGNKTDGFVGLAGGNRIKGIEHKTAGVDTDGGVNIGRVVYSGVVGADDITQALLHGGYEADFLAPGLVGNHVKLRGIPGGRIGKIIAGKHVQNIVIGGHTGQGAGPRRPVYARRKGAFLLFVAALDVAHKRNVMDIVDIDIGRLWRGLQSGDLRLRAELGGAAADP